MGSCYRHLTSNERIVIKTLLQEGRKAGYIARRLARSPSTINREINRNAGLRGYRPKQAHEKAMARRAKPRTIKMTPEVVAHVEARMRQDHSPQQISATMEAEIGVRLSHERIYRHIWSDKARGGTLYRHLRIANGKKRRKRYGKKDWRGRIPGRVDIDKRPAVVARRTRFGDWEADLVSGSHHRGFLVTLVERKSRYTRIGHVRHKTAEAVTREIQRLLAGLPVRTITYDNGREFAAHEAVNAALGCRSYFAKPYHSWERGLNENTNGLIRQYFPKSGDLREVERWDLDFVEERLNERPRKSLDYRTPAAVFSKAA